MKPKNNPAQTQKTAKKKAPSKTTGDNQRIQGFTYLLPLNPNHSLHNLTLRMSLDNRQGHKTDQFRLLDLFNPFPLIFFAGGTLRDGRFERVGEFRTTYSVQFGHVFRGAAVLLPVFSKKGA